MAAGVNRREASTPDQYGVAGHPVAHSRSPFIHGMFAKAAGQSMVYRLYDIEPVKFRGELLRMFTSGLRGLNVTVPHKQAAAEFVNELSPRAAHAEAVNTIVLRDDATLLGENTDGTGLVRDLTVNLGLGLHGKKILILGAGGATRGVLAQLLEERPKIVHIANRTPAKAIELAGRFGSLGSIEATAFADVPRIAFDLIVNATAASLQGELPPIPAENVGGATICYDMAYGAGDTPFTAWAKSHGAARALKGYGMLVEQAAESFALWRGMRPDTKAVLAALAKQSGGL
jgi:shikimate dehydrogenase